MVVYAPEVIVLFVIMGAAGVVLVAYAMARFFIKDFSAPAFDAPVEQIQYMQQVRERNKAWAWEDAFGENSNNNDNSVNVNNNRRRGGQEGQEGHLRRASVGRSGSEG